MTAIAPTLQSFFTDRLARHRQASPHTIASYRDTLRLLLQFLHQRTGIAPARLDWADLDADAICAFLDHLETGRANNVRTRNVRLTAIRSLFAYAALRHPEHAASIARVLAIPAKRFDKASVTFLEVEEIAALLRAPDRTRWEGRRDYTLMLLAIQTGLRISELLGLNCGDIVLGVGAHLRCHGKGRKQRAVPLTDPVQNALQTWLAERHGQLDEPVFSTRTGRRLSPDAVQRRVSLHAANAATDCPSLHGRKLSPHVFRHTSAMNLLRGGVDTSVIALWLGHADVRSTNAYLHADLAIKERALARVTPITAAAGRYRPPDKLLAFLEAL
ncbi:MAG: tyrosine-type recombinase/integrase [Mycobacterium sp.]|nr:tyrosine-type recombinase/integrase [Mycobacterium sp.]